MSDPSPRGLIDTLLRGAFALLAVAVAINIMVSIIRCNWPWIVGTALAASVITVVVWWLRNRQSGW